jgi:hypothetical protein
MVKYLLVLMLVFAAPAWAVELDTDNNGAIDINRGGTNAQTAAGIRAEINVEDGAEANEPLVSQVDAEAGISTTEYSWSPLRIFQAVAAWISVNTTGWDKDSSDDLADAPNDGTGYVRKSGAWAAESAGTGSGDVSGPASSTTDNIAVFADETGKVLKDGGAPFTWDFDFGDLINVPADAVDDADNDPTNEIQAASDFDIKDLTDSTGKRAAWDAKLDTESDPLSLKPADIGVTVQAYSANMDTDSTDDFDGAYSSLSGAPAIPTISDTAYNATSWDDNSDGATKNAIRDKIEALPGGHDAVTLGTFADKFLSLTSQQLDLQLTDPNADRLMLWDDNPGDFVWLDYSGWDLNASDDFTWDYDYGDLINAPTIPSGNAIIDWTQDQGAVNVHSGNYTDTNTTYSAGTGMALDGTTFNCTIIDTNTTYTAGDGLTLIGTAFNFDGGATPSGDLGGTWASPSVSDDSHAHTTTTISGIDISDDTNLAGTSNEITLSGDTLSLASAIDLGAKTSLEIPNAADPTTDAAGEIAVDSSAAPGSGIRFYGDAAYTIAGTYSKSFVILNPVATDDYPIWCSPYAITIKRVRVQCLGGTNIVGQLTECDGEGINAEVVDSSDITATANNSVDDDGTLSNPSIDAGDYVGIKIESVSGSVTSVTISFDYIINSVN